MHRTNRSGRHLDNQLNTAMAYTKTLFLVATRHSIICTDGLRRLDVQNNGAAMAYTKITRFLVAISSFQSSINCKQSIDNYINAAMAQLGTALDC